MTGDPRESLVEAAFARAFRALEDDDIEGALPAIEAVDRLIRACFVDVSDPAADVVCRSLQDRFQELVAVTTRAAHRLNERARAQVSGERALRAYALR